MDVKKSSGDFQYNSNGSLVCDGTRGITNIRYDDNNNPVWIQFDNGNVTKYIYTATGKKLRAIHYTAPRNIHVAKGDEYENIEQNCLSADSTDYLVDGNIIYKNNCFSKILFDGGFIGTNSGTGPTRPIRPVGISDGQYHQQLESWMQLDMNIYGYNFYNKDHLGNIREIVDKNGNIIQKTDYYPYGTPILFDPFTINDTSHPYKYNGKELDMMHGLNTYDYGARQYNSALPLWDRVDPLAEKYYHVSPYAYCANDPVNYVDLRGDSITMDNQSIMALYNGLDKGSHVTMTFNNGVLDPLSISDVASSTSDNFLQDLYEIAINPQMVEIRTTEMNMFNMNGDTYSESWGYPSDIDYAKDFNNGVPTDLFPAGKTILGNLGQTLYPQNSNELKRSLDNHMIININSNGTLNQRSCGLAHEFGHVVLYLRNMPHSHSGNADFIYGRQWNVMKRLGYDYLESPTGKTFRK